MLRKKRHILIIMISLYLSFSFVVHNDFLSFYFCQENCKNILASDFDTEEDREKIQELLTYKFSFIHQQTSSASFKYLLKKVSIQIYFEKNFKIEKGYFEVIPKPPEIF